MSLKLHKRAIYFHAEIFSASLLSFGSGIFEDLRRFYLHRVNRVQFLLQALFRLLKVREEGFILCQINSN